MSTIQLPLRTVTPIWTGGADGKVDRLHETGLLGSLRWWYELLLRGVGAQVDDPTGRNPSALDAKKYKDALNTHGHALTREQLRRAGLGDAAQVFGATGWRRRFHFSVDDRTRPENLPRPIHPDSPREAKGWYLDPARVGDFDLTITPFDRRFDVDIIGGLIQFLADWAALGARNQVGMGVVTLRNGRWPTKPLYQNLQDAGGSESYPQYPSLQNLFLTAVQVDTDRIQETFNLKYDLRRKFGNKDLRHFVMGTVDRERIAAKINVSLPDPNRVMRVWGWLPHEAKEYSRGWDREKVVATVHRHLHDTYPVAYWHEMKTERDETLRNNDDPIRLLRHLLRVEDAS